MSDLKHLLPEGETFRTLAESLGMQHKYIESILSGRYRPGAKLALAICAVCPKIKPRMLRPDLFQ